MQCETKNESTFRLSQGEFPAPAFRENDHVLSIVEQLEVEADDELARDYYYSQLLYRTVRNLDETDIYAAAIAITEVIEATRKDLLSRHIDLSSNQAIDEIGAEIELFGEDFDPPKAKIKENSLLVWVRQVIRKTRRQRVEIDAMLAGQLGADGDIYVSEKTRQSYLWQTRSSSPSSIVISNPAHRKAKHLVRAIGLAKLCSNSGMICYSLHATLPSHFHANPKKGKNSWDRSSTPLDGHLELQRCWQNFRNQYGKIIGFRVEEPHDDACPHRHMVFWINAEEVDKFIYFVNKCFGSAPLTKIDLIDNSDIGAVLYLLKHHKQDNQSEVNDRDTLTDRVNAYRATWTGRAIQFFDIPGSSTSWDQIRKIKRDSFQFEELSGVEVDMWTAATNNDYANFLIFFAQHKYRLQDKDSLPKWIRNFSEFDSSDSTEKQEEVIKADCDVKHVCTVRHSKPSSLIIIKYENLNLPLIGFYQIHSHKRRRYLIPIAEQIAGGKDRRIVNIRKICPIWKNGQHALSVNSILMHRFLPSFHIITEKLLI